MAEKRASSSAGFENPQVPKKLANFKKPQSEPIQSYMCFVCNETLVMSKPDMQIHVFNCRSTDTEVIEEAENEMTQETLVGNQVTVVRKHPEVPVPVVSKEDSAGWIQAGPGLGLQAHHWPDQHH